MGTVKKDQIIFLAPATQKNPVFVERMEGDSILSQLVNESCGPPEIARPFFLTVQRISLICQLIGKIIMYKSYGHALSKIVQGKAI